MKNISLDLHQKNDNCKTPTTDKRYLKVIEKTFSKNKNSDFTEKIENLAKQFDYDSCKDIYWSNPELSLLYGTPLYEVASTKQKLALNHLYWVGNYLQTAMSEASTMTFNMVTSGVFKTLGGYDTLCHELEFETEQENYHIRAFQTIAYKTKLALVGQTILGNPLYSKSTSRLAQLVPSFFSQNESAVSIYRDNCLRFLAKNAFKSTKQYYSQYLNELDSRNEPIPAASDGLVGGMAPQYWLRFLTLNWGSSPFMACQYYSIRFTGNAVQKNQEHLYVKYFRELERKGERIPIPTAVSYYHMLDEAFHTTMSQTIAKDVYKNFSKPTAYEQLLAGQIIYMMQKSYLSGLSGVLPGRCVADTSSFMLFFYKILRSSLFEMSASESLHWINRCFCQEHDGFFVGLKYHQSLLKSMLQLFNSLDYQWRINRDMSIMKQGGSIGNALKNNMKTFKQFSKLVNIDNS